MKINLGGIVSAVTAPARAVVSGALGAVASEQFLSGQGQDDGLFEKAKNLASQALGRGDGHPLPAYKEDAGPHQVKTYRHDFDDKIRGRKIPMTVYYPKNAEQNSSPVVVMSHGLAGNSLTYRYFGQHLASHGYTVLQPNHTGSDTAATLRRTPVLAFQQKELLERVEDVRFSLDLMEQGELPAEITQKADMEKVALAGHSFGALTAQGMAGLKTHDQDGRQIDLGDSRIQAFVAMSPFGDSLPSKLLKLDTDTYDQIEQPILYLSGQNDRIFTLEKGAKVHEEPFHETASDDKYHVTIGGAFHASFAQVFGVLDRNTSSLTNSTTTAFLDAHLHQDPTALDYLQNDLSEVAQSRGSRALG